MTEVLLKELSTSDIDWMIATGHRREIAAGTVLLQEGKAADSLHILLDGTLTVTVSQSDNNPLARAFAAMEGGETSCREIARLLSGEVVGEIPFVSVRPIATTVKAVEKSLVMSVPRQQLAVKLQQDVGFTSRFYRAIATLLSNRLHGMLSRLGYGRRVYSKGQLLDEAVEYEDELDLSVLDRMTFAGKRFDWMQERLRVS